MKRIDPERRLALIRRSVKEMRRRTVKNRRARNKIQSRRAGYVASTSSFRTIRTPEKFWVLGKDSRRTLLKFFQTVEDALRNNCHVKIDFSDAKELHPCGTLVFLAKLDIWLHGYKERLSATYPEDDVTEQLLQHLDVLPRLGLAARKVISHERVCFWHLHCGLNVNAGDYQALTEAVISRIEHPSQALFADCLNEAVTNTVNHAYEFATKYTPPASQQKWWMLSQLRDGHLFVAIYDLGVGIPKSLRNKPEWLEFLKLRQYKDARIIQSAVTSERTSTKLPYRGKGLPEMLEFSSDLQAGGLSIWSGKGGLVYVAREGQEKRHKFDVRLPGTLVLWEIPFREEQHNV